MGVCYLTWRYQVGKVDLRRPQGLERRDWCQLERGLCPWEALPCLSLQWDLVCEQKGLNKATSTFFFAGVMVGAMAFGYLSDRWDDMGRPVRKRGGEPSPSSWGLGLRLPLLWDLPFLGS